MRLILQIQKTVPVLASFVFAAVSGLASPIFVNNFSFENLPPGGLPFSGCGAGCSFNIGAVQDWTVTGGGNVGQFQPGPGSGNFTYFNTVPDGATIAFSDGATISQIVGNVVVGTVYTLQVEEGARKDTGFGTFNAATSLVIGTTPVVATGVAPTPGNWSTFMATYTGLPGDAGKTITILLSASGSQGDWDNVRLDAVSNAEPVPEPVSFLLLGAGLIGLAGAKRFRRA